MIDTCIGTSLHRFFIRCAGTAALLATLCAGVGAGTAGSTSAQFLKIPPGARAAAMGEAYCGLADDVDAIVWNPAGLVQADGVQQTFMHNAWLEGINQEYAALSVHIDERSAFGLAVEYVNVGDIARIDRLGNDRGSYNAYDLLGSVSYARQLKPKLAVGVSLKMLQEKIESETARALAFDAGALYRASERFQLGCSVRNAGSAVTFRETGYPLPLDLRAGASYRLQRNTVLVSDIDLPSDSAAAVHFGAEYWYTKLKGIDLAVRGGFRSNTMTDLGSMAGISTGFGVRWGTWGADYALSPYGILGMSHRLNFTLRFRGAGSAVRERDAKKVEIVIRQGGQDRTVAPEAMYREALQWYAAKVEREQLPPAEQRLLLERMKQKFEKLGVDLSELNALMEKTGQ
jgi:hypothetical protein